MGNFNRNFNKPRFGNGQREEKEMHHAVCASCGKDCSLPFRPNGRKPVYCNECFKKNERGNDSRSFQNRDQDRGPKRPTFNKRPEYGNRSDFQRKNDFKPQNNEQFEMISRKLDKITELLKESLAAVAAPKKAKKLKKEPPVVPIVTE